MYNSTEPQLIKTSPVKSISFWKNRKNILFLAAIMAISFIVYLPSLQNGFVNYDDSANIYENFYITNISNWANLFDYVKGIFTSTIIGNYNPLAILSFAFEKIIYGLDNPEWWHLNNIILHLICVLLIFRISLALGLNLIPAAFCALLFGIHPMRVESVAWVTERKDVLFGSFYLLALYYYIKSVKLSFLKRYLLIIYLSFILALLSKIQAVTLPLSMLAVDYYFDRKLSMKLVYEKWLYFLLSLITGATGIYFLNVANMLESNVFPPFYKRIFIGSYSYIVYLTKSVVPYKMVPWYLYPDTIDWLFYLSMVPALIILGSIYYFFLKKKKAIVFGLLLFTFNIMFLLQIQSAGQGFIADRFTYIAYFGLFFIYACGLQWVLEKYGESDKLIYLTMLVILCGFGYLNFEQNKIWKNGETLWSHVIRYYPNNYFPLRGRANYYRDEGRLKEALDGYSKAIIIAPHRPTVYYSRGLLRLRTNDPDELRLALKDFNKAIHIEPESSQFFVDRGMTYIKLDMIDNALQDFNSAEKLEPSNNNIYYNRAKIYINLGQYDKAQTDLDNYVRLNPYKSYMWANLGEASRLNKQYDKSLRAINKAIQMDPDNLAYYNYRLTTYYEMGDMRQARNDLDFLRSKGFKGINPHYERMIDQKK